MEVKVRKEDPNQKIPMPDNWERIFGTKKHETKVRKNNTSSR